MARLFVGNFDFERQLTTGGPLPVHLARLHAELACLWLSVAEDGDVIHCEQSIPESFQEELASRCCGRARFLDVIQVACPQVTEVVPWGWSPQMIQLARQLAPLQKPPAADVVELVNSRRFSALVEAELDVVIPGAKGVASIEDLAAALAAGPKRMGEPVPWLLKANLGQAGRERFVGSGSDLGERLQRWILPRLKRDGAVYFEPLVLAIEEAGIQWTVPRQGSPNLDRVTPLISTREGGYQGSMVSLTTPSQWEDAIAVQSEVVGRMQSLGYVGPVGIDAMRYRDHEGEVRLRPVQDINARWTMGRVAFHWRDRLSPDRSGQWLHAPIIPDFAAIATSPSEIGGQLVRHRTWWVESGAPGT